MVEGLVAVGVIGLAVTAVIWQSMLEDSKDAEPSSSMVPLGWLFIIIGAIGSVGAIAYDVSPYGELANIDAVGQRSMMFTAAASAFIAGVSLVAAGKVVNAVRSALRARQDNASS